MKTFNLFLLAILVLSFSACDNYNRSGDWARSVPIDGTPRTGAVSFVLNVGGQDYAYVGLGLGDKTSEYKTFKKYDYKTGIWTDVAEFGGEGRHGAVAFVVNNIAYVGTGYIKELQTNPQRDKKWLKDFWKYDPVADKWTQIEDFPGEERRDAVAFAIGDYGYVGTGISKDGLLHKDFYMFNAKTGTWDKENMGFIGEARYGATAFVVDNMAFVCLGFAGGKVSDNSRFIPGADGKGSWTAMQALANKPNNKQDKDYGRIPRHHAFSFVSNRGRDGKSFAYVSGGDNVVTTWRYDHTRDTWHQRESLPFTGSVQQAVAFTLDGYGYFTTGSGGYDSTSGYTETWKFIPDVREDSGNDYDRVF